MRDHPSSERRASFLARLAPTLLSALALLLAVPRTPAQAAVAWGSNTYGESTLPPGLSYGFDNSTAAANADGSVTVFQKRGSL